MRRRNPLQTRAGSVWSAAAALVAGLLWLPAMAHGADLVLSTGSTLFSDLDGGPADSDGVSDGVLTVDELTLAGDAQIHVDEPSARFEVAGDVELKGRSAVHPAAGSSRPRIEIRAGGRILVAGTSSIRADAASGGELRVCAGGDVVIGGNAAISANAVEPGGAGGSVHVEAGGHLSVNDAAASVQANGATGGEVALVSCGTGDPGPGRSTRDAALGIQGRVEAIGTDGAGGTVEIEARQGGVAFAPVHTAIEARGTTTSGGVSVTAATGVSPESPPSDPAATVATDSPSNRPCDCSDAAGPLVIAAEVDRPTGLSGTQFTFSGRVVQSTAPVVDWRWSLSDGRELAGRSITVSFPEPGIYGAAVTATDSEGTTLESETGVVVFDPNTQGPPELGLPPKIGDVDGDGAITLDDAHRVAKHAGDLEPLVADALAAADVDLDGSVTRDDSLLLGQAVAADAPLPTALSPDHGAPGTRVNLISPVLLDPTALIEVEVGESSWVQKPLRAARGYATFAIPLDATVRNSVEVVPGPVEVRIRRDGAVVETLTFEVEAPEPLPADPRAELRSFLDDYVELFELNRAAIEGLLDVAGVDGDERELLLATFTAAQQDAAHRVAELKGLLDQPGGDELAEMYLRFANANGFTEYRERLDEFLETRRAEIAEFRIAVAAGTADVDQVLSIVCAVREASELLSTGNDLLETGCDALLAAAVIAAVSPFDGPVVDAALFFSWASGCGTVEATLELALLVNDLVGSIEPDLRFEASPSSPGPGESSELRAEIELAGIDDICSFTVGRLRSEIIEELAEEAIERLLRKKLALRALSKAVELLSESLLEEIEDRLEVLVVRAVDHTAIGGMLEELAGRVCDYVQIGVPLLDDLSEIMEGPVPDVGTLTFNGDGTASYTCPESGSSTADSVSFTARRDVCGEAVEKTATVGCETRPVTITIGDNGALNDDIFEVRIEGEAVLTSSAPVRSISTTVELPVGDHVVEMIGRAAPDGIGTYFITFSGATVIGGDATSGTDLTPGVVKTFVIRVQ